MDRSTINDILRYTIAHFEKYKICLPPFAFFSPEQWLERDVARYREIFDLGLGWDVTDMGGGDFEREGLTLFTLRNGSVSDTTYRKPYAEKVMLVRVGQVTPMHFHWHKMEDIINRGGGDLVIEFHSSTPDGALGTGYVTVAIDGERQIHCAGSRLRLRPGQSITIPQRLYHSFWAEGAPVIAGEVSMVNDDSSDNRFFHLRARFSEVVENARPLHLLCNEYARFLPLSKE